MSIQQKFSIDQWDFKSESVLVNLPEEDKAILLAHQTEQEYNKGEIIFRENSYPSGIFYVVKGKVKKYKIDKNRKEHIIYVANTGELIGFHAILSGDRFPDSAAALEKSIIAFIPKEDFLQALAVSTLLSTRLLKTLSHEFAVLANSLSIIAQKSVRERLALQLVVLSEKYKDHYAEGSTVEINMSRDDLANLVGTARENVVRILSEFKAEGWLITKGRIIIILDVDVLIKVANM
ncbi:Crp/Fnr family transcriptional regulator [Hydrotalea sp.]|uniref:Crp/Fnr family transcriptional regulator n=1 Tax=Hydrotalea sp. TaxID=2881279 RepID=UPI00261B055C|nr:Crp/Fnr family transcriptional regulator [Hydrotalea sp.]